MKPVEFWVLQQRATQEFFSETAPCGKGIFGLFKAKRCDSRDEIDAFRGKMIAAEIKATGKEPTLDVVHFRVSAEQIP